jgi:hypothetical protein
MQLTVKLTQMLPIQTGTGKNRELKKQDFIVERQGQCPKKVCISVCGSKINEEQLIINKNLKIDFENESRQYCSKWYTDIKVWKIEVADTSVQNSTYHLPKTADFIPNCEDELLPF